MRDPFRPDLLHGQDHGDHGRGQRARAVDGAAPRRARREGGGARATARAAARDRAEAIRDSGAACRRRCPATCATPRRSRPRSTRSRRSSGPPDQLVSNAAGNFLSATEDLSPNAFNSVVQIVLYGTFHCTAELGRRLIARKAPRRGRRDHDHLRGHRLGVRRALGRGQGRRAGDREEPGRRVGLLRHPAERDRARPVPDRGRLHPAAARLGARAAGARARAVAPLRRAPRADEPRRLPAERREPVPDRGRGDDRRGRGPLLGPAVRRARPPRAGAGARS